jgi:uridine kinase
MTRERKTILVCGGSCSGKTTLAAGLADKLRAYGSVQALSMDDYYFDLSGWDPIKADNKNFDAPSAIDSELLFEHIKLLMDGTSVPAQSYDFKTHIVSKLDYMVEPAEFLVVEGIFALYFEKLRNIADVSIFIHADADIRLAKRVHRDYSVRRLPVDLIIRQYLKDVRPMHDKYIEPYGAYADLVLDSGNDSIEDNLQKALEFIGQKLDVSNCRLECNKI